MDITRESMDALFKGFKFLFQQGFDAAPVDYRRFCMEVVSSTSVEVYPFLEQFGKMREWVGDRQLKNIRSKKFEVKNKSFEDTVVVSVDDLADDHLGLYKPMIEMLGNGAAALWGDLAVEALQGGNSTKWLDGKNFFATDRKYGKTIINNLGSEALSAAAYKDARAKMRKYKGATEASLGVIPTLLICGPDNEATAFDVLKSELSLMTKTEGSTTVAATGKNPWAGKSDYLVLNELGSEWFLLDCSKPLKPVVIQQRKKAELTRLDRSEDSRVFMAKEAIYGTDCRGAAFLSMPHLAYGSFPA